MLDNYQVDTVVGRYKDHTCYMHNVWVDVYEQHVTDTPRAFGDIVEDDSYAPDRSYNTAPKTTEVDIAEVFEELTGRELITVEDFWVLDELREQYMDDDNTFGMDVRISVLV